jgi:MFS family permease
MSLMVVGAVLGGFVGGFVVDQIGRRRGMALLAVAAGLAIWAYTAVPRGDNALLLLLGLPYALFTAGLLGGLGSYLAELFPTEMRGAGQGLSYNIGEIGRALGPLAVGILASTVGLPGAIDVAGATAGLVLIALLFLPETKGKNLDDDAAAAPA